MKRLFLLFILAISLNAYAQNWISSGAIWHYDWSVTLPAMDRIEYVDDTLIQGKTCQKLITSSYMFRPPDAGGGILSYTTKRNYTFFSGDTVYYFVNDQFKILYCLNANIGDVWDLGVDTNEYLCGKSFVQVTDMGTDTINNIPCEWLSVTTLANSSAGFEGKIYKKFGAVGGYLFPTPKNCNPDIIVDFFEYNFSCFQDNNFPLHNITGKECDYLLNSDYPALPTSENYLTIVPNPVEDQLELSISSVSGRIESVEVFNSSGSLCGVYKSHILNVKQLNSGVYYVLVKLDNGQKSGGKFVKL